MAAYFVAQYVVNDLALYREYQKGAGPTIQASGAELVVFDAAAETMEGINGNKAKWNVWRTGKLGMSLMITRRSSEKG